MKHFRCHCSVIVSLAAVLLSGASRVTAQTPGEPPVPPNFAISQIQDSYGEGKHYVQFPTQAGFHYTVEQSMDLLSWQTAEGGYFYGNGSAKQFYVMQIPPPAPPPSVPGVPPGQWLPRIQKQYFFHDAYLYINKSGGPEAILSDCKGSGGNFQVWYNVIQASAATPPQSAFPSRNQTHIYHFDMENAAEVHSVTLVVVPLPSATFSGMPSTPGPVVGSAEAAFSALILAELPQVISALTVPETIQVETQSHMATVFVPAAGGSQAVARIIRPEPVPAGLPREWFVLLNASFPTRSKSIFTRFVWPEPPPALLEQEVTLTLKPLAAAAFASLLAAVDANQDGVADAGPGTTHPEPKLRDLLVAHSGEIATAQSSTDVSRYYRVRRRATDSNLNGLPDWFEFWASYNPFAQAGAADFMNPGDDPDGDGLTNLEELNAGLNPTEWDTDGDNQPDGAEVDAGTDPTQPNGVEEPTLVVHQTGIIQPCDGPARPFVRHIMSTTSIEVGWRRVYEPAAISAYFSSPPQNGEVRTFTSQMKMLFPPDGPRAALVPISFSMATDCSQEVFEAPEDLENPVNVLTFSPVPGTDVSAEQSWSNSAAGEDPMMFVAAPTPVDIIPDLNMVGVVGDVIKSAKPGSQIKHFVTPKKDLEYVIFKAVNLTADQITPDNANQIALWEGGEEVPGEPLKRKVKRDATGMTEVKIRNKKDNSVAVQMNVWVVWTVHRKNFAKGPLEDVNPATGNTRIEVRIAYKFAITPKEIVTEEERPNLTGPNTLPPPNHLKQHIAKAAKLGEGVDAKWDVSRQMRIKILNPHLYTKTQLPAVPSTLWEGQPKELDIPEDYPANPVEGNDDTDPGDEDNNPYDDPEGILETDDTPVVSMLNSTGQNGDTFVRRYHFNEFVRLNLGQKWFLISSPVYWRAEFKMKKHNGVWTDDGSLIQENNDGW